MGLRDDKKRETRSAILQGALARFREEGFEATRVRDIAAEARISEATFFNYFPSKQAVLEEAAEELLQRSMARLAAANVVHDDPVPDRLEAMLEEFVADFASDRELASLLGAHTTFFTGSGSERLVHAHALLASLFEAGQERGEIRRDAPSTQLAQLFLELVMAMVRTWCDDPADVRPLGERLRLAMSILLRGCVTEQARARAPELDQLWSSAG